VIENYEIDAFGVIHQINWQPKAYDAEYMNYYEGLRERTIKLGYQRLGWVWGLMKGLGSSPGLAGSNLTEEQRGSTRNLGSHPGETGRRVLEFGYGLGTFLEAAQLAGFEPCVGCDITKYPLPAGCSFCDWDEALARSWDVVGMFDVLEHIPDLSFLGRLDTRYLAVAVPWCQWHGIAETESEDAADDWFANWRMLLPDEHLHHFDPASLDALMAHHGFTHVEHNTFEDGLRLRPGEAGPNVLSAFYAKASVAD